MEYDEHQISFVIFFEFSQRLEYDHIYSKKINYIFQAQSQHYMSLIKACVVLRLWLYHTIFVFLEMNVTSWIDTGQAKRMCKRLECITRYKSRPLTTLNHQLTYMPSDNHSSFIRFLNGLLQCDNSTPYHTWLMINTSRFEVGSMISTSPGALRTIATSPASAMQKSRSMLPIPFQSS